MQFRFTIGRKIGFGFTLLILLTFIAFFYTRITLNESRNINDDINRIYTPSVAALEKLNLLVMRSKMLISNWVYFQSSNDNPDKDQLRTLISREYPAVKKELAALSKNWQPAEREEVKALFDLSGVLFRKHRDIMAQLNSFDSYDDPNIVFIVRPSVEEGDVDALTKLILKKLSSLVALHRANASRASGNMIHSFDLLQFAVQSLAVVLVVGGIFIAFFTVRSIVKPVSALKKILLSMGKGILPEQKIKITRDEIGDMSLALNELVEGMRRTTVFAHEVESGNFESVYKPLSEQDTLGLALLKMRTGLAENERVLEAKVIERTEEVVRQKEVIETKNRMLEVLYTQITDSIRYAKRIQEAILPPDAMVKELLPDSFIFYKPKDIVSGDFYWLEEKDGKVLFAVVDCTGHGVPGAFMSIVGYNILKHAVYNMHESVPGKILDNLSAGVNETLHQSHEEASPKDAMDIALCSFDRTKNQLHYAGAYNPLYLIRNGSLTEYKADKFPIGFYMGVDARPYTNKRVQLQKGDMLYIFSDGYADQFGGPRGRKFMLAPFRKLLIDIHKLPLHEQKNILDTTLEQWKGGLEQVDDILVMGVRV